MKRELEINTAEVKAKIVIEGKDVTQFKRALEIAVAGYNTCFPDYISNPDKKDDTVPPVGKDRLVEKG